MADWKILSCLQHSACWISPQSAQTLGWAAGNPRYLHDWLVRMCVCGAAAVSSNLLSCYRILTLYAKSLPLDIVSRIWDCYFLEGELFLFRTAVGNVHCHLICCAEYFLLLIGILRLYNPLLIEASFEDCVSLLTHLPEVLCKSECVWWIFIFAIQQNINEEELFSAISKTKISANKFDELIQK